jgi:PAS domain S-box-containing protein
MFEPIEEASLSATERNPQGFAAYHSSALAWAILVVSLVLTAIAWHLSNRYIKERAEDRFVFRTDEMTKAIEQRMLEYEQVLRGGVGLLKASDQVSRDEWRSYFTNAEFQEHYPGIQGVGFSRLLKADEKPALLKEVRDDGFPDFDIRPPGNREVLSAIVYLEPFDWRNQRAFGYDMYSEATRRAAMDTAIKTGRPTISGVVTLVQETDSDVQRGFLLYLPVFENGKPVETDQQRAEAAIGFVYAPFRAKDFMAGIGDSTLSDIEFEVFDATDIDVEKLVHDSDEKLSGSATSTDADFCRTTTIDLRGRDWTLLFESQPDFVGAAESAVSLAVACGGLLVDVLLFLVIGSIGRQQRNAEKIAARMTDKFRKSQQQFQAVCDTANDPIVLLDQSRQINYTNPASASVFGDDSQGLIGNPVQNLFCDPVDASRVLNATNDRTEVRCRRSGGDSFPVVTSVSHWKNRDQEFTAIVLRDVTDQKRSASLIQQQITELRRSNRDLDDFAYVASHDLRSPLRNIDHLANWVLEDAGDSLPATCKEHLARLKNRIERMDRLLNDLLQYARAGRVQDDVRTVDLQDLVDNIINLLANPKGIRIDVAIDLPDFETLRTPLETCLRNLIGNAIKHHDRDQGCINVSAVIDGSFARIEVQDDGPGIDPKFRDKIFKIFQTLAPKADNTISSGIGLSIVKKTAETYGGKIKLESKIGHGSTFILYWPTKIVLPESNEYQGQLLGTP